MQLTGIHHLTAISAPPRDNLSFHTGPDQVSAYHLFYADPDITQGTLRRSLCAIGRIPVWRKRAPRED
jgi:hypothetical protein